MAIIRCEACEMLIDDDLNGPCEESKITGELTCPSCLEDEEDE